ncbi:MAG: hypothetical protein JWM98_2763 [Thermoleophilia bacterium]|nr:hypothetical protein [Thermoleophilia bacterium]
MNMGMKVAIGVGVTAGLGATTVIMAAIEGASSDFVMNDVPTSGITVTGEHLGDPDYLRARVVAHDGAGTLQLEPIDDKSRGAITVTGWDPKDRVDTIAIGRGEAGPRILEAEHATTKAERSKHAKRAIIAASVTGVVGAASYGTFMLRGRGAPVPALVGGGLAMIGAALALGLAAPLMIAGSSAGSAIGGAASDAARGQGQWPS